jgi:hypothetical protein
LTIAFLPRRSIVLRVHREPVWSGFLTAPLAGRIPATRRPLAIAAIKAFHSVAFFSIAALIVLFTLDGVRGRASRRTALAATIAIAESAIYASNNQVCPLTPLVEELGAERGTVSDIFLPEWLSLRVPPIFGSLLLVGLILQIRLLVIRRCR